MNTTVKATDMSVKAATSNAYLQIKNTSEDWDTVKMFAEAKAASSSATIKPVSFNTISGTGSSASIDWYYAINGEATNSYDKIIGSGAVTDLNGYALVNSFEVRVKPTTQESKAYKLKVTNVAKTGENKMNGTTEMDLDEALRVLVVGPDGYQLFECNDGEMVEKTSNQVLVNELTSTKTTTASTKGGYEIKVYVYFDGADDHCFTNNAIDVADYTVSLVFNAQDKAE